MLGTFASSGAMRLKAAAASQLDDIETALGSQPRDRAGVRLRGNAALRGMLAATGPIGDRIIPFVEGHARPVRAILFDKNPAANWSLAWHQDRTICVKERHDAEGFGPWTVKSGLLHVAPPIALLERMITIRIHFDDVAEDNAPLLIAPGSHRLGLFSEDAIDAAVAACGTHACLAEAGDIWVYATPILHASAAAQTPRRRRVLQVDYAGFDLPGGLLWAGI